LPSIRSQTAVWFWPPGRSQLPPFNASDKLFYQW